MDKVFYPDNATDTIKKWMEDGLSKKEAIKRWEEITFHKLPEIIKSLIKEEIR